MPKILVDARENNSGIIKLLENMPALDVEVQQLDCGDYLIHNDFVVERKAAADFINSIRDGRLFSQIKLMKATYGQAALILEGDLYSFPHGFAPASLQGALSDLVVLEGISVIPSKNQAGTAGLLATMCRHAQDGLGYEINLRAQKPKDMRLLQQYIIEGFPGCGAKRAQSILEYFGSVHAAVTAAEDDWRGIPGLGKETARKVFGLLHVEYR